jgi:two-component system, NarL family, response regulator EvgA
MEVFVRTVLIVNEDNLTRSILHTLFDLGSGFDAFVDAGNSTEAVAISAQLLPNLVVLDFALPGINGIQLARRLMNIMPKVPIFMLTKDYTASSEREALSCGITAVFSTRDDLMPLIENARAVCGINLPAFVS